MTDVDDAVFVARGAQLPAAWRTHECDVILPLSSYDLGMRTRGALRRQLAADVPRSVVRVDGKRVHDADAVLGATRLAGFCTQAALAAPVEWVLNAGLVAYECGRPMEVDVEPRAVSVYKELGLREWDLEKGRSLGTLGVRMRAQDDLVVVTLRTHVDTVDKGVQGTPP